MIAELALALATLVQAPADTLCPGDGSALNCMTLVPTPDLPGALGAVVLRPVQTPFGVAATVDGRPRYRLSATIAGLPPVRSLGGATVYVAWSYSLALDSAVKLGVVGNGAYELGELDRAQFRLMISAERSATVASRHGRLVLRGTSPGTRLLAHRDLTQAESPGALRDASAPMSHHEAMGKWTMPPMPRVMSNMPGMAGLTPTVEPMLPAPSVDAASLAAARPRETVQLESGDTLALEAGLVRRTIAGRTFVMYGYNGQYPGPLIEVKQGATIVVRFHNAIDQPSSVHWHGVRLDNRFDGTVGVTQEAVLPGGSFTYTVHFPDAGIYWYHPHVREDVQQDLGLYGNMLVRARAADELAPVNREAVLMLDDIELGERGATPYGASAPTHALMGRFGNVLLVNGEPRWSLRVKKGEVVRFYLTNASSARLFNVSFGGARMKVVAGDLGRFAREEMVPSVVIAPAERYVVDVEFARAGDVALVNRVQALDHMIGAYSSEADTMGVVHVDQGAATPSYAAPFVRARRNSELSAASAALRAAMARPAAHSLVLTLRTNGLPLAIAGMLQGINAPVEWNDGMPMMNWVTTGNEVTWVLRDAATGKENMDIDWRFAEHDTVKIRLFNDPSSSHAMQHPIHLHGQRFLVVSRDGVPNGNLVWKDTAIIAAGETVELLVEMSNPGRWMLHCHVAEHLGAGMMMVFSVGRR